ncbi:MAG TPA: SusD/RagB family nutrient-binding outer membrane lipoprotein [Flavobacterium sp.]|jgi:hypothetical protein
MKNIFKLLLLFFVGFFTSCETELDINTDPNSPQQINPGLALASAQASLVTVIGGDFTNLGGFYAQYHTQAPSASQYQSIDQYNINTAYANRVWAELYAGCLTDLKYVIDESNSKGDTGTALIGTLLNAYTFQLLTDVFGDVPYTEALLGVENITPNTTPGNIIYSDLLAKIDAALQAYNSNPVETTVGGQDNIYSGNMENWIKFANTLKLKMYLRMAYTPFANPAAVNALLSDNNFITTDAKFANFGTSLNQRNPFWEVQNQFLGDVNNIASSSILEFYNANNDSRANFAFRKNAANVHVSLPQGAGLGAPGLAGNYSRPRVNPLTPVYLMTVSESNFLQAEGLIRYASGNGAQVKYEQGILESFKTYQADFKAVDPGNVADTGVPILSASQAISDAQALFAVGGPYAYQNAGSVEQTVRQVIVQKWASLVYINNIESYIETKRTKFPEVVAEGTENYSIGNRIPSRISVLTGLSIPSILYYPDDEVNRNPNITQHSSLTQKVWWDQK